MQSNKYDVVVVGAGPAGLHAAELLAAQNKKVIVFEQSKFVGNKLCANGLTRKDFRDFNLPRSIIEKDYNRVFLYKGRKEIILELVEPWLWTIDRMGLAKWQLAQARKAGAEVRMHSPVHKITKGFVEILGGERFGFDYLIGADGSNSIVRRFLKLPTQNLIVAMQYHVASPEFWEIEIHFDLRKFGPHYAWIFPHRGYAAVGTAADSSFLAISKLRQNFFEWCRGQGINPQEHKLHAHPINYDYQGMVFERIFLLGDAAGLGSGLTGEGIYPALVSAAEVAHKILDPEYKMEKIDQLLETKFYEEKALRLYKKSRLWTKMMFSLGFFWLRISKTFRSKLTLSLADH